MPSEAEIEAGADALRALLHWRGGWTRALGYARVVLEAAAAVSPPEEPAEGAWVQEGQGLVGGEVVTLQEVGIGTAVNPAGAHYRGFVQHVADADCLTFGCTVYETFAAVPVSQENPDDK